MKLYLSRLVLDPRCRQVQAELRDSYQMHRTLSKAFGDGPGEWDEARVLFRVDEVNGVLAVLVQSKTRPEWSGLTVSEGYLAGVTETKEFSSAISRARRLAFRLLANPTVKRGGKRYGIPTEEGKRSWLDRKGQSGGFRVLDVSVTRDPTQRSVTSSGFATELIASIFEGVLEVTDPDAFARTLESGIGSAKGFGFGLLSVAPVRR